MPAVRGYKIYSERQGRTLSIHDCLDDALRAANAMAELAGVAVEVLDDEGRIVRLQVVDP